jgi:hypothetical protein
MKAAMPPWRWALATACTERRANALTALFES